MNKKIILSLGASALLVSSLLACPQSGMKQGNGSSCKQQKMMKGQKHHNARGHDMLKVFMQLDLSDKQRTEIRGIMQNSRKSAPNPHAAFTDSSFDKQTFIKLAKEKRDTRAERKAQVIEDIYNVLSVSQKKDFKTILDMRNIMKANRKMRRVCD